MKKILFPIRLALILLCTLCLFSCRSEKTEFVKSFDTAEEAAEHCGLSKLDFVPTGYKAEGYRSIYDIVCETVYTSGEKTAVLRVVDSGYNTSNLSGYIDTSSEKLFIYSDERELEIKRSDGGAYSAEWSENIGGLECNIAFSIFGGEVEEFEDMLSELLGYLESFEKGE